MHWPVAVEICGLSLLVKPSFHPKRNRHKPNDRSDQGERVIQVFGHLVLEYEDRRNEHQKQAGKGNEFECFFHEDEDMTGTGRGIAATEGLNHFC